MTPTDTSPLVATPRPADTEPRAPAPPVSAAAAPPPSPARGPLQWFFDFYWAYFLTRFCHHLLLVGLLLLLGGLLFGVVGGEYGVRYVIFYDAPDGSPVKPAFAGAALAVVVLACLMVGYLADSGPRGSAGMPVGFAGYATGVLLSLGVTAGVLVGLVHVVRVWAHVFGGDRPADPDAVPPPLPPVLWGPFAVGFAGCVAVAVAAALGWRRAADPAYAAGLGGVRDWLARRGRVRQIRDRLTADPADPGADGRVWPRLYAVGVAVQLFLVYLFVTWLACRWWERDVFTEPWVPAVLAGAGVVVLLAVANVLAFPHHIAALIRAAGPAGPAGDPAGASAAGRAAPVFLAAAGAGLAYLSYREDTRSPAVAAAFLMVAVVAGYGFLTYVARRAATPAVLIGLLAAAVFGGANPYKMRWGPDLPYPADRGPLDLVATAETDADRQREFDALLAGLLNDPDYLDWEVDTRELEADRLALDLAARDAGGRRDEEQARALDARKRDLRARVERLEAAHGLPAFHARFADDPAVAPVRDPRREARTPPARPGKTDLLAVDDVPFRPVTDQPAGPRARQPVVLVAVSGGGIRSAAWTLTVLHELEAAFAAAGLDFPGHVRLISGASGGMLGAAEYVATLPDRRDRAAAVGRWPRGGEAPVGQDPGWLAARARERDDRYARITADSLTPLVNRMVYNDLPATFSPWRMPTDRGWALEEAWFRDDRLGRSAAATFADLRARELTGDIPSLVFSPMMIEDGRRLLISNLNLRSIASNDASLIVDPGSDPHRGRWRPGAPKNLSLESLELFRLFPGRQGAFRLATAARMSASFPFFSPAVPLPTTPRRRVVDAGYYDNYGVGLTASWLFTTRHRDWLAENASKVVLVQIRDGSTEKHRRLERLDPDGSTEFSRAVEELTSPPEGLYNARVASSSFRNDGQLELLSSFFREAEFSPDRRRLRAKGKNVKELPVRQQDAPAPPPEVASVVPRINDRFFATVVFEYQGQASLNWYLTRAERQMIRDPGNPGDPVPEVLGQVDRRALDEVRDAKKRRQDRIVELIRWWNNNPGGP